LRGELIISESMILDRDRIECLVRELRSYYEWIPILDVTHENHDKTDGCRDGDANPGSGRLQTVREADQGEASRGAVPEMPEKAVTCYAFIESNGSLDLDSIAETEDAVRQKMLAGSMGWRFENPERYSHDEAWQRLLVCGRVVQVSVREVSGQPDNGTEQLS